MGERSGQDILSSIRHGLIVSCQAMSGEPLDSPMMLAAMAASAEMGGAVAIRANSADNVAAIRKSVSLPIIALNKVHYPGFDVYITSTFSDAQAVSEAGGDIIALDATSRPRPGDETMPEIIERIHRELHRPVMADISTLDEALAAADAGADLIATTLAGYTPYSRNTAGPDFVLLDELVRSCRLPVIVEGRVFTPEEAKEAILRGAYAVVVGTAITRPSEITKRFVHALRGGPDTDAQAGA